MLKYPPECIFRGFYMENKMKDKNKKTIDYMTKIAILAALSSILYFIPKFPLPFLFPSFLEIQFSNLPAILGGFILGPFAGGLIVAIRTLIKLPFSSTACVGELADFLIGIATVLTSSIIYKKIKTKKGGAIALIFGSSAWVLMAIITNYAFLIDFYAKFYADAGGMAMIIEVCKKVLPSINENNFMRLYLFGAVLPFNLLLSILVSIVTFMVYKRISDLFKKELFKTRKEDNVKNSSNM